MAQKMDSLVFDALLDVQAFPEVAPSPIRGKVCILGEYYNLPQDSKELLSDVSSRLWITYRKNFRAISGTSLTSDAGWGCTLRCGQMLVAQALVHKHLGRNWRWEKGKRDAKYMKILKKFLDVRDSEYSIQMIALQGADFGRLPGQWLGPNNVAQAIKKLSVHDQWTELAVHVAMDMVVVVEDIKMVCQQPFIMPGEVSVTNDSGQPYSQQDDLERRLRATSDDGLPTLRHQHSCPQPITKSNHTTGTRTKTRATVEFSTQQSMGVVTGVGSKTVRQRSLHHQFKKALQNGQNDESPLFDPSEFSVLDSPSLMVVDDETTGCEDYSGTETVGQGVVSGVDGVTGVMEEASVAGVGSVRSGGFRPLLLFIPLRLGQETFNMDYVAPLKKCLSLPQSVGFIGGRPRHAQYFIGYHDDNLWYLDPHTTQPTVVPDDFNNIPDSSYHCSRPDIMPINELDPSIALGFLCRDEADIDNLCTRLRQEVLSLGGGYSMFELTDRRPSYWGPLETTCFQSIREPFLLVDTTDGVSHDVDSDDSDFEIISWPGHTNTTHH